MAGGRYHTRQQFSARAGPQWSPGLMAGGSPPHVRLEGAVGAPQWSPGLMAGGSCVDGAVECPLTLAAMEPRPDGRGK